MYSDETFFFKSNHFTSLEQQGYFHFQAKEAGGSQVSLMGPILFLSHQTFCHASPTGAWQVCMDNFQQFHLPSSDMTDQHQSYQDTDTAFLRVLAQLCDQSRRIGALISRCDKPALCNLGSAAC
ncbi:hypothetical protein RRG08_033953 [Elysia crispata]|uniref:Uncharacterized protein n=1 Tax=Elysia crispata TaxID=231223 RepID=A0AAE1D3Z2_9GAST|nr:hypothetical protein RRG08_033953 [Elysia crispata]